MEKLKSLIETFEATTRPADSDSIQNLEHKLGFPLSEEYKKYLSDFGLISFESEETYGLGVPDNYYLNVHSIYADLSRDTSYPSETVPLLEIGDGQYYLYDNILHNKLKESEINREDFNIERKEYWKFRADQIDNQNQ